MCCRRCCRPDFNPHARHVSDGAHSGNQPAFRGPEICGVGTEEDAAERDLTPRTISNCLRHLEIKLSKRSLMSNSSIKPLIVAGSSPSINSLISPRSFLSCFFLALALFSCATFS